MIENQRSKISIPQETASFPYYEALAIDCASLPPNHPRLAISLNNLAGLYESQGKYGDADPLYLESLQIKVQALPEDHPSLKTGWYNVLDFYRTALAAGLPDTRKLPSDILKRAIPKIKALSENPRPPDCN